MRKGAVANMRRIVEKTHAADLAAVFQEMNDLEQGRLFQVLIQCQIAGDVLSELAPEVLQGLLLSLADGDLVEILTDMDSDDAADMLSLLPEERRVQILADMNTEDSEEVGKLLDFPEDSAGGIMTPSYFALGESATAEDTIKAIQSAEDAETVFYVYVLDEEGRLVGVVSLRRLLTSPPQSALSKIMDSDVIRVDASTDQEHVAALVAKYDLLAIPVIDSNGKMAGIITVDDVIDVLREEATEDIYKMAGTSHEELVYGNKVFPVARVRMPWLLVTLFGGIATGGILWLFRGTIDKAIALITFLPVIAGMGGNVGTQSSSILVRAFATGRVDFENLSTHLWKEIRVGLLLGAGCGVLVGVAATLWHGNPYMGFVVGISMVSAMTIAATMGTLAPAFFRKMEIDPAVASGPFVSTANDISGMLIYLGTATALIHLLLPHAK